jgi:hypothetical protein
MKCSKHFATEHGQSHLPSNMVHVVPTVRRVITPEGTPVIILEFRRRSGEADTYLRIRMSEPEAYGLIESFKVGGEL